MFGCLSFEQDAVIWVFQAVKIFQQNNLLPTAVFFFFPVFIPKQVRPKQNPLIFRPIQFQGTVVLIKFQKDNKQKSIYPPMNRLHCDTIVSFFLYSAPTIKSMTVMC